VSAHGASGKTTPTVISAKPSRSEWPSSAPPPRTDSKQGYRRSDQAKGGGGGHKSLPAVGPLESGDLQRLEPASHIARVDPSPVEVGRPHVGAARLIEGDLLRVRWILEAQDIETTRVPRNDNRPLVDEVEVV
jgi:hypothetical protein